KQGSKTQAKVVAKLKQSSSKIATRGTRDILVERTNGTLKKRKLLDALNQSMGIVSIACQRAGVGRTTFYRWLRSDPKFSREYQDILDIALDFVEGKLLENIADGDVTSIIFYLKTKGKHRGYTERAEFHAIPQRRVRRLIVID